jgi:hypothetical protein
MNVLESIEDEIVKQEQCHVDALDEIITLKQQQSASPITATKTTPKNSKAFHIIRGNVICVLEMSTKIVFVDKLDR